MYIKKLPKIPNKTVALTGPEKAMIKAKNKIIILKELQPSMILEA